MGNHFLVLAGHHETYCLAALLLYTLLTISFGFMVGVFPVRKRSS